MSQKLLHFAFNPHQGGKTGSLEVKTACPDKREEKKRTAVKRSFEKLNIGRIKPRDFPWDRADSSAGSRRYP